MKQILLGWSVLAVATVHGDQVPPARSLAITSVIVIDVAARTPDTALKSDQTIVVRDGRIASVGSRKETTVPPDAQRIDGTGKYVIPGLWDMHAHVLSPEKRDTFLPLYVVNGITSLRDMHSDMPMDEITVWRRAIAAGTLIGPRLAAVAGPLIGGPGSRASDRVATEDEARRAVHARMQMGADFVKVGSSIPREAFLAIADESRRQGLMLVGHVPGATVAEAVEAGQHGIEHAGRLLEGTSTHEVELTTERLRIQQTREPFMLRGLRLVTKARQTHSQRKLKSLADLFRSKGTWLVPTLVQGYAWPYVRNRAIPYAEWVKYMPQTFTRTWTESNAQFGKPSDADFADAQANFDKTLEIVGAMHRAGVKLLAGTDANGGFIGLVPGISLHYELALLVQAGLTPLEALRTATLSPAMFLNIQEATGSVASGKAADLVLLDANPLRDIYNTQKISAVIVNGRVYDRPSLDRILTSLGTAAREQATRSDDPQILAGDIRARPGA